MTKKYERPTRLVWVTYRTRHSEETKQFIVYQAQLYGLEKALAKIGAKMRVVDHEHPPVSLISAVVDHVRKHQYVPPKVERLTEPRRWSDVLPRDVALEQEKWERYQKVLRLREQLGLTFNEIGEALQITRSRANQLYHRADWDREKRQRFRKSSPIEEYFKGSLSGDIARQLRKEAEKGGLVSPTGVPPISGLYVTPGE